MTTANSVSIKEVDANLFNITEMNHVFALAPSEWLFQLENCADVNIFNGKHYSHKIIFANVIVSL